MKKMLRTKPLFIDGNIRSVEDGRRLFLLRIFDKERAISFCKGLKAQRLKGNKQKGE